VIDCFEKEFSNCHIQNITFLGKIVKNEHGAALIEL